MNSKYLDDSDSEVNMEKEKKGGDEEEDEYVVEKIVDKHRCGRKVEYLIKWQGWSHDDNSWEPEDHLNCPEIMKDFEEELKAKKGRKMKREKEHERDSERERDKHKKEKHESSHEKSSTGLKRIFNSDDESYKKKDKENRKYHDRKSEEKLKKRKLEDGTAKLLNINKKFDSETDNISECDDEPVGFERGLEAEKIFGILLQNGIMKFLMKWKDSEVEDLVDASEAKEKCPQVVIKFYERRLQWVTPPRN